LSSIDQNATPDSKTQRDFTQDGELQWSMLDKSSKLQLLSKVKADNSGSTKPFEEMNKITKEYIAQSPTTHSAGIHIIQHAQTV
jgi:hypothetical protein